MTGVREAGDVPTTQPSDPSTMDVVQRMEAAGIRDACEFDLLLFFTRHPRVVLSSEQLATYVGHEVENVARALDLMLGASLLQQAQNPRGAGRMYILAAHHVAEWLEPVRRLCATTDGRRELRTLLKQRRSQRHTMNEER
jgi:hypothetical protein